MYDLIQKYANIFCNEFGLGKTNIGFAVGFTRQTLKIYNFLLTPKDNRTPTEWKWEAELSQLAEKGRHDAMKDYLWREVVGGRMKSLVSQIEAKDVRMLRAAIEICENRRPSGLADKAELEYAEDIAARIRKFHAQGKALKDFKDVADLAEREVGKMPVVEAKKSDLVNYVHEAIHYVLRANNFYTNNNHFNEGLCSFLHMRFQGKFKTWRMYHWPGGRAEYMFWSQFFFERFKKTPNGQIVIFLKRNFQNYLREFEMSKYH